MIKLFVAMLLSLFSVGMVDAQNVANLDTLKNDVNIDTLKGEAKDSVIKHSTSKNLQEYQGEKLVIRKFNESNWKKVADKTDFTEKQQRPPFKFEPWNLPTWSFKGLKILIWIIVIGCVAALIYFVIKNTTWQSGPLQGTLKDADISKAVTDINDFDFTSLLRQAIAEGNFKLAIRIYYLHVLRKLNDTGKIVWKKDKTNREYLSELFAKGYFFDEIRKLTLSYEQVWYGEHSVSEERFKRLSKNFEELQQLIQGEK